MICEHDLLRDNCPTCRLLERIEDACAVIDLLHPGLLTTPVPGLPKEGDGTSS